MVPLGGVRFTGEVAYSQSFLRFSQMNATSKRYVSFLERTLHASERKLLHDFTLLA
jgi:hypothetical protein